MKLPSLFLVMFLLGSGLISAEPAGGHGGGLNAKGCHNNRKTGDYHCHNDGSSPITKPRIDVLISKAGGAYRNCAAARAAGAAPVRAGDPGYGRHLDRDGDGVGCE